MPAPSSDILGHRAQLAMLSEDLEQGNIAHAYLFAGARHVGKFTVAKWFAKELLTAGTDKERRPQIVHQVEKLIHPDILVIDQLWIEDVCEDPAVIAQFSNVPQQHRAKAKAKTDTISIDDIRAVQERLHEVSTGKFRCCLIRSVERMQDEAVNALLKILEEPPPGVVFLLTTQSLSSLLPTLLSRSRMLHFDRVRESDMEPLLQGADDDERRFVLRVAQGAPGVIRRLRMNPEALRKEKQAQNAALAFWHSHSPTERLQLLSPLYERGAEAEQFLLHLALACREEIGTASPSAAGHLTRLAQGLQTNVNRQLLTQQFVLSLAN